jgi:hypothetical protein
MLPGGTSDVDPYQLAPVLVNPDISEAGRLFVRT